VLAVPCLLFLSCAATATHGSPGPQGSLSPAALPSPEGDDARLPPDGAKRLPSSIDCEPEPPCEDCLVFKGEKARHVGILDKEVIRPIIRSHVPEVRACYNALLATHPDAAGKVMIKFGITASGSVATSCLVSSELHDQSVEGCIVDLPFSWTFPKPDGGGWVLVSYPFVFAPR
jgi:hypothetical protein